MKKRQKIHKVALRHNDKLRYSIAVNLSVAVALLFFVANALNTGSFIWYAFGVASIYYLVAVGLPNTYRLSHHHVNKPVNNAVKAPKRSGKRTTKK
jgi:hypothetical protein